MLPLPLINQIVPSPIYRNAMCLSPLAICHHIFQTSLPPPPLTQFYHIKILDFRDLYNFMKFSEPCENRSRTGMWNCNSFSVSNTYAPQSCYPLAQLAWASHFSSIVTFYIRNLQVFPTLQSRIQIISRDSRLIEHCNASCIACSDI